MTTTSITATVMYCVLSAIFGSVISTLIGKLLRSTKITPASNPNDELSERNAAIKEQQLKSMVEQLYHLTSQVDSQVGQHTMRINEITHNLEEPDETGSSMVLAAGKLLIAANQKLQADLEEAKSEIQRQREQTNACMLESRTDALTGLANRRAFDIEITRAFSQRRRDGKPLSLLIIDVDHFKRVNDKYGHMVGDRLLKGISRCLMNTFHEADFVARYGGEEFVAILSKTPLQEAIRAAERVRLAIADNRFRVGEFEMEITASVGVKEVEENETEAQLMEKTDAAMYAAKTGGRNRCFYHDGKTCQMFVPVEQPDTAGGQSTPRPRHLIDVGSDDEIPVLPVKAAAMPGPQVSVDKQAQRSSTMLATL